MVTVIAVGKQIEIDPGKLRINEDIVEICEKDINNLTFGTSYAEFISRITGGYVNKTNYRIIEENKT